MVFAAAARKVARRLLPADWLRGLHRSALVVFPLLASVVLGAWFCGLEIAWGPVAAGVVLAWLTLTGVWAASRRPTPLAAMAFWDARLGRHEMFTSALCFEAEPAAGLETGRRLHLARAVGHLSTAVLHLPGDVPLPRSWALWWLPLAFLSLALLLPAQPPTAPGEARIDDEARASARDVADCLLQRARAPESAKSLSTAEEKELRQIKQDLAETAQRLKDLDRATQRDVLSELEQRARRAEELAQTLADSQNDWPSSKMIAEMERHADTAELASGLQAKDFEKSSAEAQKLADRLQHPDLTIEERKRIEHALEKAIAAADKTDKQGLVHKHVDQARRQLAKDRPKPAGQQFQRLAKAFSDRQQRQLTRKQLEQMANQLRAAGQQIFGGPSAGIRQLAQASGVMPQGLRSLDPQMLQANGQSMPLQLGTMPRGGVNGQPVGATPIPGQASPGAPAIPVPGMGAPSGNMPVPGSAPIPGGMDGNSAGLAASAIPVPGAAGVTAPAAVGGTFAGRGTAAVGGEATKAVAPQGTSVVQAAPTGEGPSQIRDVQTGVRREDARRQAQRMAAEFIKVEEQSLADEPLPVSRRQQVLRYFTALRSRLVEPQPSSSDQRGP